MQLAAERTKKTWFFDSIAVKKALRRRNQRGLYVSATGKDGPAGL
jgi:hypothetical protein